MKKYSVCIMYEDGRVSYLKHKGRTAWSLRTARRHAWEFLAAQHNDVQQVTIEEA